MCSEQAATSLPMTIDVDELQKMIIALRKENAALRTDLENLKESTIVQSMNDMRDEYLEIVRKNVVLEQKVKTFETNPVKEQVVALKRKLALYTKMFNVLRIKTLQTITSSDLVEKALRFSVDEEEMINLSGLMLEGLFLVQRVANSEVECFLEHDLPRYRACLENDGCTCIICHELDEEDNE